MMFGFEQVDSKRFYRDAWPKIKHLAREAHLRLSNEKTPDDYPVVAKSNWEEVKTCTKTGAPTPPLLIYWGYKDEAGTEKTVLAITRSTQGNPDEYWIAPNLLNR